MDKFAKKTRLFSYLLAAGFVAGLYFYVSEVYFPPIQTESEYGALEITQSDLELLPSVKEELGKNGPRITLSLVTKERYPDQCYELLGGSFIWDHKVYIAVNGVAHKAGFCGEMTTHPSLKFDVPVSDNPVTYSLRIRNKRSVTRYRLAVTKDAIGIRNEFSLTPIKEFLRIPAHTMWVYLDYSGHGDKFLEQKRQLLHGLTSLGAQPFVLQNGNYAFDGGVYFDEALYFKFYGDFSQVRRLLERFAQYACDPRVDPHRLVGDCMSIHIGTRDGENASTAKPYFETTCPQFYPEMICLPRRDS